MVSFPPCKINLGLDVIRKRPDGYHDISTCFYPVQWCDILEIIPSEKFEFSSSGIVIPGSVDENLCIKAYNLLKRDFNIDNVRIHLHKIIPTGAGLGGGSSDAAHTLRLLNKIFSLNLTTQQLMHYAAMLGSDCAFFVQDDPMIGTGRGEILEKFAPVLKGKFIVLVKPDIHVSTAEAYAGVKPEQALHNISDILSKPLCEWKNLLKNDFEFSVFQKYTQIKTIKDSLYDAGAIYASMSGSGAAVFGIFDRITNLEDQFSKMAYWSGMI